MAFNLFNTAKSWLNGAADAWYKPLAGHYDAREVSSPSYSPVNFIGDYYSPSPTSPSPSLPDPGVKPSIKQPTAQAVSWSPVQPSTIDYLNADIAKHYGMSAETAYQEALSNTAYQRAMKDMKSAGLNPAVIFGSGRGSGADGVSYVSSASSGLPVSSGGFRPTSAKKTNHNLFSEGAYYGLSAAIGLVGALLMKSPTGYWIGNSVAQGALGAANAGYKARR